MSWDLFSKRKRRAEGRQLDVFTYDAIPDGLKVQVCHIIRDCAGETAHYHSKSILGEMQSILCREYGFFQLSQNRDRAAQVIDFFLKDASTDQALDVIELAFQLIDTLVRANGHIFGDAKLEPDAAIMELNQRFLEHGIGYQFESGQLNRVDSKLLHAEIVKPTLGFLSDKKFKSANQEFLTAHEHYRHERYAECLNDALKAFESTMKVICSNHGFAYDQKDTAKTLIDTLLKHQLIPAHLANHFAGLRSTLEGGVPTVRNRLSGHGKGVTHHEIPAYIAGYALHITAANILMLVQASADFK